MANVIDKRLKELDVLRESAEEWKIKKEDLAIHIDETRLLYDRASLELRKIKNKHDIIRNGLLCP